MSNFPIDFDDDTTLPVVNDNITEIGGEAINALRDAVFNIEQNIGLGAAGTTDSIASRIDISLFPDGTLRPSAITGLGLVTLPITDDQISNTAQIVESKLRLDHRTQDLFNYIKDLSNGVNTALGWVRATGIKLEPHLLGAIYKHSLSQIDVDPDPIKYLKNKFGTFRDNSNSYLMLNDLNSELLTHQFADGSLFTTPVSITTFNGSTYPSNYAHTASGIFLNTSRFSTIPQTADDIQQLAEFIDSSSIFLYGTRIQNLYSNGISRNSRSSSLLIDGYGPALIPPTSAIAYLKNTGTSSSPVDDINFGDDIIEFKPSTADMDSNAFDAKFALVKVGDIVRINYGTVEVQFIIKEKKYIQNSGNKKYIIRINGKNLFYSPNASARIDKSLFYNGKYGVLSLAAANNNFAEIPSLIVSSPRGGSALGLGFNPDLLDSTHYLLYLALFPTGLPQDGYTVMPAIDVTGNRGTTPGKYTLDSVVEATNNAFRQAGYNYRFTAFQYQGEFGIMLADSYNNSAFSIINAVVDSNGFYNEANTNINFPNNVIGIFSTLPARAPDPLGMGPGGSNVSSPPYQTSYGSAEAALNPTKLFVPLKRNNYYVNGTEKEKLSLETDQLLDDQGNGYWAATVQTRNVFPGPNGRVQITYRVPLHLASTNLKAGKTLVVQSLGSGGLVNFGRFIIQSVTFSDCNPDIFTDIAVYDAVHATAISPAPTLDVGAEVALYFNSDSVSFNQESATDFTNVAPFKRHFEVYVDQNSHTFTHERGRINASAATFDVNTVPLYTYSELNKLNIVKISPKLRGYQFGSVNKISLNILEFNSITGAYTGYLAYYDGTTFANKGPFTFGKKGQVTRFYDETNIDYIDVVFDINVVVNSFTNQILDFQLFPTLSLDKEIMMLGTCQLNDVTNSVSHVRDERQFGNISEEELSSSALNFISLPEKLLHGNGVVRGFDLVESILSAPNPNNAQIYLTGGLALVNGKFINLNNEMVVIPLVQELNTTLFDVNWAVCVNDKGEYQPIPLLDFDPALNTPNDPTRLFQAFNPANGATYYIDASTFSNILNTRKDLAILYIVAATITAGPVITLAVTDARKYVFDVDSNLPLRLTSADSQGNFKSPAAILNWIKYNNAFNGSAIVKGADATSGVIDTDIVLDFNSAVTIDGENNALLTMNGLVTLGSNLTIKNLDIVFNGGLIVNPEVTNLTFENCNIQINLPEAPPLNVVFEISNGNNINFIDCEIDVQYTEQYDPIQVDRGAVFRLSNTNSFNFLNNDLSVSFDIDPGVVTPGDVFVFNSSPGVNIRDSEISGNFNKCILISQSNSLTLVNTTIISSYNPNAGVSPDSYDGVAFDPADLVNSGQGYIYSNVSGSLTNILIDGVIFNYTPSSVNSNRYSFVNFKLSNNTASLNNLIIRNCRFNHTVLNSTTEDIRAAIAIVNYAANTVTTAQQPILRGVTISNNICNRNQAIIITSHKSGNFMLYPGLVAQGCIIDSNICGAIGYWVAAASKVVSMSPNVNALPDKDSGLIISNNTCHYIYNADHTGKYFLLTKLISGVTTNVSAYQSGAVSISNNKTNWIHTGITGSDNSSLHIIENFLSAYDPAYLDQYDDTSSNTIFEGHGYAIFVSSHKRAPVVSVPDPSIASYLGGNNSSCIISRNVTSAGYWLQTNSTTISYGYAAGYIFSQSSAIITDNILKGMQNVTGLAPAILVSGSMNTVTGNHINRLSVTIQSYVAFAEFDVPNFAGLATQGTITDNFFDSPYIDNTSLDETVVNVTSVPPSSSPFALNWTIERNKNQTGYLTVPLTNAQLVAFGSLGFEQATIYGSEFFIFMAGSDAGSSPNVDPDTAGYKSNVLYIHDEVTPAVQRSLGYQQNLDRLLPHNVRVATVSIGVRGFDSVFATAGSPLPTTIHMFMNRYDTANNYLDLDFFGPPSLVPGADIRVINDNTAPFTFLGGLELNSTTNTIIKTLDLEDIGISGNFISGRNNFSFSVSLDIRFKLGSLSPADIYISPIVIKYRW
jgi:hypothetical protein